MTFDQIYFQDNDSHGTRLLGNLVRLQNGIIAIDVFPERPDQRVELPLALNADQAFDNRLDDGSLTLGDIKLDGHTLTLLNRQDT